jgi:hypothetical protein
MINALKILLIFCIALPPGHVWAKSGEAKKVTISKPDLPWVDAEGIWSGKGKGSAKNSTGLGSGAGRADGNGNEIPAGSGQRGSGSNGKSGNGNSNENGNKNPHSGNGSPELMGSTATAGGQLRVHQLWWPVCMFLDQGIDQAKANAIVKGVIEKADRCQVNVVVWTRTVKTESWPPARGRTAHEPVNRLSVEKCNLPSELATAGSATALVPPNSAYDNMAAKMCDDEPKKGNLDVPEEERWNMSVAGCAELRKGDAVTDEKKKEHMKSGGSGAHSHNDAKGGVAASIEVTGGHSAEVVSHEAIGHSQMGKPNGSRYGLGIGEDADFEPGGGGEGPTTGDWSPAGCIEMRRRALDNTRGFGFDPSRQTYYVPPRNSEDYYDLQNGEPIFGSGKTNQNNAQNLIAQIPRGQTIGFNDAAAKNPQKPTDLTTQKPGEEKEIRDEVGEGKRHRLLNAAKAILTSAKNEEGLVDAKDETPETPRKPSPPPPGLPEKSGARLGFDDNAPKRFSGGSSGGESVKSSEAPPSDLYSGAVAEDGAAGASLQSSAQGFSQNGASGSSQSIGFDDNAPKRGVGADGAASSSARGGGNAYANESENGNAARATVVIRSPASESSTALDSEGEFFDEEGNPLPKGKRRSRNSARGKDSAERSSAREERLQRASKPPLH